MSTSFEAEGADAEGVWAQVEVVTIARRKKCVGFIMHGMITEGIGTCKYLKVECCESRKSIRSTFSAVLAVVHLIQPGEVAEWLKAAVC